MSSHNDGDTLKHTFFFLKSSVYIMSRINVVNIFIIALVTIIGLYGYINIKTFIFDDDSIGVDTKIGNNIGMNNDFMNNNDMYSWENVIKPPLYHGQIIPNPDDIKREKKKREMERLKNMTNNPQNIKSKNKRKPRKNRGKKKLLKQDDIHIEFNEEILSQYIGNDELEDLRSIVNEVNGYIEIMNGDVENQEFTNDYWDFPEEYRKLENGSNVTAKHVAYYELYNARKKWFYQKYYLKPKLLQNERNKFTVDNGGSKCIEYKMNDKVLWTPNDIDLCNYKSDPIFWHRYDIFWMM